MKIPEPVSISLAISMLLVVVCGVIGIAITLAPTKCTAPWKILDKTVLPSALEQLAEKTGGVEATSIPGRYMQNKLVITMVCEPLGIYETKVVSNP